MNNPPILLLVAEAFEPLAAVAPSHPSPIARPGSPLHNPISPLAKLPEHYHDSSSSLSDQSWGASRPPPPLFAHFYSHFPFWMLVFCQKFHSKIKRGSPLIRGSCNKYTIVLSLPRYPGFLINCGAWGAGCLQERGRQRGGRGSWQKLQRCKTQPSSAGPSARSALRGGGSGAGCTRQPPGSLPAPGSGIGRETPLALIPVG